MKKIFSLQLFLVLFWTLQMYAGDTISYWKQLGHGVNFSQLQHSSGNDIFIGFAGWTVEQPWVNNWVQELCRAKLNQMNVKYFYAVKGPKDVDYKSLEIDNKILISHLLEIIDSLSHKGQSPVNIIIAAHSSGSYVAHQLLTLLYINKLDTAGITKNKITYFCLDGGIGVNTAGTTINQEIADNLIKIYGVYAFDQSTKKYSPNKDEMLKLATLFNKKSDTLIIDATTSGCKGNWCIHETFVNKIPHNPNTYDLNKDYSIINSAHPVCTEYLNVITNQK
jgi:hypothetical protein